MKVNLRVDNFRSFINDIDSIAHLVDETAEYALEENEQDEQLTEETAEELEELRELMEQVNNLATRIQENENYI